MKPPSRGHRHFALTMDPLSVMTSVAGLLGTAAKIGPILFAVSKSLIDAPRLMGQLISQVNEFEILLSAVHKFLLGMSLAPRRRISMISVEQLVVTLTEAVLTFSELEALVTSIARDNGLSITTRLLYVWNENTVSSIMLRLERHKTSLSLMLNIAQWYVESLNPNLLFSLPIIDPSDSESDLEAQQSQETLQSLITELLRSNNDISRRLQRFEDFDSRSIMTTCYRNGTVEESVEDEIAENMNLSQQGTGPSRSAAPERVGERLQVGFHADLSTSRVYNRTKLYESDVSFTSSACRTHAWSMLSGMSLSEISVISVIALPLSLDDISNRERYTMSGLEPIDLQSTTATTRLLSSDPSVDALSEPNAETAPASRLESESKQVLANGRESPAINRTWAPTSIVMYKLLTLQHFVETYDPTIWDSYRKHVVIDGQPCMLEVLETGGQAEYSALRDQWVRDGDGFVLVYCITKRSSFDRIRRYYTMVQRVRELSSGAPRPGAPIKSYYPPVPIYNIDRVTEREVSQKEGQNLAKELGCDFVETSVKNCINVEKAFYDIVRQLRGQGMQAATQVASSRKKP
ncbi:putative RAS-2 protein [Rutstroemia sp. NJR-2017a BVV2]|nr:putative RAS-2 protein [Rutstroemia sp. NJR-2017a BVV2]